MSKDSFLFKLIYLTFVFFIITGSNIYLGPITLKYVITVVLFVFILYNDKTIILDKVMKIYMIFIFSYMVSSLYTGHVVSFANDLLKNYFPAYVGYRSTILLLYDNKKNLRILVFILLAIGCLDVAVTYSQFSLNASWYIPIQQLFQFSVDTEFEEFVATRQWLETKAFAPGIFFSATINGYYLSVFCLMSANWYIRYKRIWMLVFPSIFIIGLFVCQERGPFFLSLILLSYIILSSFPSLSKINKILVLLFLTYIIGKGYTYIQGISESMGLRYSTIEFNDTGRSVIQAGVIEYIFQHPLFPNFTEMISLGYRAPHNLFLNAFVYGGIISFICIMYILIVQTKRVIKYIRTINYQNPMATTCVLGLIAFHANSLLHNRSIVTGDCLLWILSAILLYYPLQKR